MGMKHTSIANHILLGVTLLSLNTIVQIVDSTAEQSNVYHKYLHGEGHAARVNGRFSKSLAAAFENSPRFSKSLAQEFDNSPPQHSKSIEEDVLSHRSARVNSRRFSKSWEEELDNSTVQAVENNTVEENMEASSTATTDAVSYYPSRNEKPSGKVEEENTRTPGGGTAGTSVKPTKYHYYPHNQHIYLLPECAVQQVCNAVYVRLNYTQPLCACPSRYREPCSASINSDDFHTTELTTDPKGKVLTLVKTCEPVLDMRLCRSPRDWSLLALQNIRTGKSHYLVICRCPDSSVLEGPMSHDQPTYASVPGIRVYGMMCVTRPTGATPSTPSLIASTTLTTYRSPAPVPSKRKSRPLPLRVRRSLRKRFYEKQDPEPAFPWDRVSEMLTSLQHQEDYAHQGQVVNVQ